MNIKNDELVLQLIAKVKDKKKEINDAQKPKWETSCTIGYNPENVQDRINIQTTTDLNKLVDLYGFLTMREESSKIAAKNLGLKISTKYMGYTFEDWKTDIQSRVNQININLKKKELEELEARLDKLVTPEQRREIELAEIQKLLD